MCYMYAVPISWELPRHGSQNRKPRATPLLQEHFDRFADVTSRLITVENEGYAVVLLGKGKRQGAGVHWESGLTLQISIVTAMKEKSKGTFRVKQIALNYSRSAAKAPTYARGVGGVLSEHCFFFYKGSWPRKLPPKAREEFGGTTWDDRWEDVPQRPDLSHCVVPYAVKQMIFDDTWSSRTGEGAGEGDASDSGDEDAPAGGAGQAAPEAKEPVEGAQGGTDNQQKDKEKDKANKDKQKEKDKGTRATAAARKGAKGKKSGGKVDKKDDSKKEGQREKGKKEGKRGKRKEKPSHAAASAKEARMLIVAPSAIANMPADQKTDEPLFSNEYHGSVYRQSWSEWGAKAAVVFTPGNGIAAQAAVQHEFPVLLLALSVEHAYLLEYFVDTAIAMDMQVHREGNRLHDRQMTKKIEKALNGNADSDDGAEPPKQNKRNKTNKEGHKKKGEKTDSDSSSGSDGEDSDADMSS